VKDADLEILSALPAESGRDRIVEDIDVYAETPPEFPDDEDENELPMPSDSETAGDPRTPYTELCHQFVQAMIQLGRQRVLRPVSSKILEDWERKLTPRLDEELKRKPYNVREVREWIVDVLRTNRMMVTFKALCSGLPPYEIPRVFFSVLNLVNTGEVRLEGVIQGQVNANFTVILQGIAPARDSDSGGE
jgi:hypothetical protein